MVESNVFHFRLRNRELLSDTDKGKNCEKNKQGPQVEVGRIVRVLLYLSEIHEHDSQISERNDWEKGKHELLKRVVPIGDMMFVDCSDSNRNSSIQTFSPFYLSRK